MKKHFGCAPVEFSRHSRDPGSRTDASKDLASRKEFERFCVPLTFVFRRLPPLAIGIAAPMRTVNHPFLSFVSCRCWRNRCAGGKWGIRLIVRNRERLTP